MVEREHHIAGVRERGSIPLIPTERQREMKMWKPVKVGQFGYCLRNGHLEHRIRGEAQVYTNIASAQAEADRLNANARVPNNTNVPGWMR